MHFWVRTSNPTDILQKVDTHGINAPLLERTRMWWRSIQHGNLPATCWKQYKESVGGKFDDITDIILGSNDSSDKESSDEEAPGEEVIDIIVSGEEEETVE